MYSEEQYYKALEVYEEPKSVKSHNDFRISDTQTDFVKLDQSEANFAGGEVYFSRI